MLLYDDWVQTDKEKTEKQIDRQKDQKIERLKDMYNYTMKDRQIDSYRDREKICVQQGYITRKKK